MNIRWRTFGAVLLIGLSTLAASQQAPAQPADAGGAAVAESAAPPVAEAAAPAEGEAAGKPKVFTMTIGGEGGAPEAGSGVTISVGDEKRSDLAGRIVEKVVDDLEAEIADLPEDVRRSEAKDIEDLREAVGALRELDRGEDDDSSSGEIIGALSVLLLFGGPILIVAIVSYNNRRKRQMVHETIDRIIAQGKDVPVELLDALDKGRNNGKSMLSRGTVNVALGIGIGAFLYAVSDDSGVATIGLIPLCIGAAQLLVWKLERPGTPTA